jgi:hypothetical protein
MLNNNMKPSIIKKIMFSYFPNEKRPRNMGIRKIWEDKVQNDIELCQMKNWRRDTLDRDFWREVINRHVIIRPVNTRLKEMIFEYKQDAVKRRN